MNDENLIVPPSDGTAIIFNGAGTPFEETKFPLSKNLDKHEILVSISLSTVCGSDLHTWQGHRPFPTPCILGHEMVGKIIELGNDIKNDYNGDNLAKGDRIVWSMTVGCGDCYFCNHDLPQKCVKLFKYGHVQSDNHPYFTGGFAKYVILKKGSNVFKVPPELSDEEAAPLMCAGSTITSGLDIANFDKCNYVVIQGCGGLGLYGCAFSKEMGASKIIVVDPNKERLELAKEFGADYIINANNSDNSIIDEIRKITEGRGADYVIEVTGDPNALPMGIKILKVGGKYILLGAIYPESIVSLDSSDIITKCLQIFGMHNYKPENLRRAIELVKDTKNKYPYKKLVGPTFDLSVNGLENAFKALDHNKSIRPAIVPK
tara:strand:+ start:1976 stop:3100 length:1125 start_codon:yes stop_codon:yes gene_type:complete